MNVAAKKWKENFNHSPPSLNVSLALVFGFATGETLRQKKKSPLAPLTILTAIKLCRCPPSPPLIPADLDPGPLERGCRSFCLTRCAA